ncbi:hypothetical protein EIP86_005858 [Pleurotus ostreatoroseus]|nr:hypothetical protein EIP86_005858 [Pleurotus ostreatoroseus]
MFSKFRKSRPDMHTSRAAWEQSWEEDFNSTYNSRVLPQLPYRSLGVRQMSVPDEVALSLYEHVRSICELQRDLGKEAALRFAEDDFENEWLSVSQEKRREVILEGIVRTMCIPDMEERRRLCPDSTLTYLASREGMAYLDMLKTALPIDLDTPITEPVQFPHPIVDRALSLSPDDERKPGVAAMNRMMRLFRTFCLTTIIWHTLLAFYGKREDQVTIKPPRADPAALKGTDIHAPRAVMKRHNELRAQGFHACWACGKHEGALAEGQKLMACSACRKINRKILYCSSECQKQDWKTGKPRPHKCFRADAFASIIPPYPKPDIGIALPDPIETEEYCALVNGDPEAVKQMFRMIAQYRGLQSYGVSRADVQKQLEREFGLSLDHPELDDHK